MKQRNRETEIDEFQINSVLVLTGGEVMDLELVIIEASISKCRRQILV